MYQVIKNKLKKTIIYKYICEILVCLFSIISNVYWRYAWIKMLKLTIDIEQNIMIPNVYYLLLFNILYQEFQNEKPKIKSKNNPRISITI